MHGHKLAVHTYSMRTCSCGPAAALVRGPVNVSNTRQRQMAVPLARGTWSRVAAKGLPPSLATLVSAVHSALGQTLGRSFCTSSACSSDAQHQSSTSASSSGSGPSTSGKAGSWDWEWVVGKNRGRKPAIKRPARHQWWYCNPNYTASDALPAVLRPPHAPPGSTASTDWEAYAKNKPGTTDSKQIAKYRREFVQFMRLRDLDWREAFQRGLAGDAKQRQKARKQAEEAARQQAWREYKDKLFADARKSAERDP